MLHSPSQVRTTQRLLVMAFMVTLIANLAGCSWVFRRAPDPGFDLVGVNGAQQHVDTKSFIERVTNGLDSTTQSTAITTGGSPSSRAYRGVQMWNLVREYGLAGAPDNHGNSLNSFVVASGSDGYQALFSAGELDPSFGNSHALVAVQTAGGKSHAGPSAFLTTAPLDEGAARYVMSLVRLEVQRPAEELLPASIDVLVVDGAVDHPLSLRRADLAAMPQISVKLGDASFQGVALWDVLSRAGVKLDVARKGALLTMYLTATGQDGYQVVVSLAEASPNLGARRILIGYPADNNPNAQPRLVIADDIKRGRAVSQLCRIHISDAASR